MSVPITFNPPDVAPPPPTFHHVAVTPLLPTSKLITLAGQVGIDPDTGKISHDFNEQVKTALINVSNCLKAAGATPRDIIHVRHYVVREDLNMSEGVRIEPIERGWAPLWVAFMDREAHGHRPPDTVLEVAGLAKKELLYEVEVWAVSQQDTGRSR